MAYNPPIGTYILPSGGLYYATYHLLGNQKQPLKLRKGRDLGPKHGANYNDQFLPVGHLFKWWWIVRQVSKKNPPKTFRFRNYSKSLCRMVSFLKFLCWGHGVTPLNDGILDGCSATLGVQRMGFWMDGDTTSPHALKGPPLLLVVVFFWCFRWTGWLNWFVPVNIPCPMPLNRMLEIV